MATLIRFPSGDFVVLDAAKSITIDMPSTTTSFPVESGSKISDHIIPDNKVYNVEGVISDATNTLKAYVEDLSPGSLIPKALKKYINFGFVEQFLDTAPKYQVYTSELLPEGFGKAITALQKLEDSRNKRELVTLEEGNGQVHENLAITSIRRTRDSSTGIRGIGLSISLMEIRIVSTKAVTITQQRKPAASKEKSAANDTSNSNATTTTDNKTGSSSIAADIAKKISG